MLSQASLKLLSDNGYVVNMVDPHITIANARKPIGVYIFIFALLVVSIPFILIYSHPGLAAFIGMLAVIPAYAILKGTEVPDSVSIDVQKETIDLISTTRFASRAIHFDDVKSIPLRSMQVTKDSNAFNDGVVGKVFYLCFNFQNRSRDIFKFTKSTKDEIIGFKKELESLILKIPKMEAPPLELVS